MPYGSFRTELLILGLIPRQSRILQCCIKLCQTCLPRCILARIGVYLGLIKMF